MKGTNGADTRQTSDLNVRVFKDGGALAKIVYSMIRASDRMRIIETLDNPAEAADYLLGFRNVLDGELPCSRTYRGREVGKAREVASPLWLGDEPPPMEWAIDGLVPLSFTTLLFAQYESYKSYLAMLASICLAVGIPFLGRPTRKTNVLWIDRELNEAETKRRAFQVARGLGLERPPEGLYYYRPQKPIGNRAVDKTIKRLIEENQIGVGILDSLSVGSSGDMKEQHDVVSVMKENIESWDIPTICIDHITKAAGRGNLSEATPFGSIFKGALARSMLNVVKADGGGLTLRHDKSNFSVRTNPIHFTVEFSGPPTTVIFRVLDEMDPKMAGITNHMPSREQTLSKLKECFKATNGVWVTAEELADARGMVKKTIQNHICELGDRVEHDENGRYRPVL